MPIINIPSSGRGSPHQNTAAPAATLICLIKTPPCGFHRAPFPSRAGGTLYILHPAAAGCPTHCLLIKTPPCGVHRAPCPSRAGGTTSSSPPRSAGCLTNPDLSDGVASTHQDPDMRGPPRLLPIVGGGDHILFSTPLRGVSNPTCLHQQDPA